MRNKIPKLAEANGLTTREYLAQLMTRHTLQREAAQEIGVSQPTLSQWLIRVNLQRTYTPVQPEQEQE